ncbi:MAG: hypothetical protein ABIZ64_06005 [Casimicrobium sp.]
MTLFEAMALLQDMDDEVTVFAVRPWTRNSAAMFGALTEDCRVPTELKAAGLTYFLEATVAKEIIDDRTRSLLSTEQIAEMLLYYGEFDGFPDWANKLLAF